MPKPSKRLNKPFFADLSEVIITRNGEYADIAYRDPTVGGVSLKIGPDIILMNDEEILDRHNEVLLAMKQAVANYNHEAVEIPLANLKSNIPSVAISGCRVVMFCVALSITKRAAGRSLKLTTRSSPWRNSEPCLQPVPDEECVLFSSQKRN